MTRKKSVSAPIDTMGAYEGVIVAFDMCAGVVPQMFRLDRRHPSRLPDLKWQQAANSHVGKVAFFPLSGDLIGDRSSI